MIKKYYSIRTGKSSGKYDLESFKEAFLSIFQEFEQGSYFNEHFGWECVDAGSISGIIGNVSGYFLRQLKKKNLWPIAENLNNYTEDDLFDVMELLSDNVSKPLNEGATYHQWGNCGWHYQKYAKELGFDEFQQTLNAILEDYGDGYQMTSKGEIVQLNDPGLANLLEEELPTLENSDVENVMRHAIDKFRSRNSSELDKKEAIKHLTDCLESLREKARTVLTSKDEDDLFNLANNFGVRHKNDKQKNEYDKKIWLSWMFYYYLATLHAVIRLIKKPIT